MASNWNDGFNSGFHGDSIMDCYLTNLDLLEWMVIYKLIIIQSNKDLVKNIEIQIGGESRNWISRASNLNYGCISAFHGETIMDYY